MQGNWGHKSALGLPCFLLFKSKPIKGTIKNIKPIKANVFDDTIQPEAKIDYVLEDGSVHKTLEWCAEKDGELNIKLFNSNCVQFSLSGERKISFKPQIFNICEQLSVITSAFNEKVSIRLEELKQAQKTL